MTMRRRRRLARWRRRYRAGLERVRGTLHLTRRGFRYLRWLVWTLLVIALLVYGLFPNITWESDYARQEATRALDQTLTRPVTIASARMNLLGDMVLRDVVIAANAGESIPHFARVPKVVVYLALRPLTHKGMQVEKIELIEPEMRMVRYPDGKWNSAGLFDTGARDTEPYRIGVEIEDGHYLLDDHRGGTVARWDCRDVNGDLDLVLSQQGEYTVHYDGEAEINGSAEARFSGMVYPARHTVTVDAQVEKAAAAWLGPYLATNGLQFTGGTLQGGVELQFRPDTYHCKARVNLRATGASWQGVSLPPADGELQLVYRNGALLQLERVHLVRDDIDLLASGTAADPANYDLTVGSNAFPLAWLQMVAGNVLPELRASGTFAGELSLARHGHRRAVELDANLANATITWLDRLHKRAGLGMRVLLSAGSGDDGALRVSRLQAELDSGVVLAEAAPRGEWSITYHSLRVEKLRQVSPALDDILQQAGLTIIGPAKGSLTTGVSGVLTMNLDAVAVASERFNKPADIVPLHMTGRYQRSPRWQLTAESWRLGGSGGRMEYADLGGGLWRLIVVAHTLKHSELRGVFPQLASGPLSDLSWSGPLGGELTCTVDSSGEHYAGKILGTSAGINYVDWWAKLAGMPFTVEFDARRTGEAVTVNSAKMQAGNSHFRVTGASNIARKMADFTVNIERCQPSDLQQMLTFWRTRPFQFGDWDGEARGSMHVYRSDETIDCSVYLDLGGTRCEFFEPGQERRAEAVYFRKEIGEPAAVQFSLAVVPTQAADVPWQITIRRADLGIGAENPNDLEHSRRSRFVISGEVIPKEKYEVDLTLQADIYTPQVGKFLLNLEQRRIVGYPVPALLDALQDSRKRIDLEWRVHGVFNEPQFDLEVMKAVNEGLRNTIDNRFRLLGLVVGGTLNYGGRVITLPLNVLRLITREAADTPPGPGRPEIHR